MSFAVEVLASDLLSEKRSQELTQFYHKPFLGSVLLVVV